MKLDSFFQNLRVVELASVLAGPAAGMFFAELGAQVVKVENRQTGGDTTRHWKLPQENPGSPFSAYFHSVNWNKTSVFLDFSQPEDHRQLLDLIRDADLVIANFKAGSAQKMGLDYPTLSALNPRLIYASVNAYGENDPRPGFDVVIQAETGWIFMNGEPGGVPCKMPVALMDLLAAHQLKEGILCALLNRQQTGKGCEVSVSLFDAGVSSLANQAANFLNLGVVPQRMGSRHPNIAPYGETFFTQDGKPLILSPGTERHFRDLCDCLELPEVRQDARFQTNALRLAHREVLNEMLEPAFRRLPAEEILRRCEERKVPVAPIRNLAEVFEMPAAQDLILEEELPDGEVSKRVRTAVFKVNQWVD